MDTLQKTSMHSPGLTARIKREVTYSAMDLQQDINGWQIFTGMTPSGHNDHVSWLHFPVAQPCVENTDLEFTDRQLDPLEWVELLEQTECLDYVSPDIDACIERQSRMEGNQELDLTGREFVDSPAILKISLLGSLPSAESSALLMPVIGNLARRPGLREHIPRQSLVEHTEDHRTGMCPAMAEKYAQTKRPARRSNVAVEPCASTSTSRSASRSLSFEDTQRSKTRHKRASWSGHSRVSNTSTASRRECKSARKSKDCIIPGCTKGARSRGLCKRHGGGKRCTHSGCSRSDQGGGFCIAHGGGKRCAAEGCKNSAQSRGLCKSHGGGKRCRSKGCAKSSQAKGFCRGHRTETTQH